MRQWHKFCSWQQRFVKSERFENQFEHDLIYNFYLQNSINFHFNPPTGSHFGGLFEAVVKSTKFHLKRVVGDQNLTFEEATTLLTQIEAILNSRPLCTIPSNDPDTFESLTPAHFLIGRSILEPNMLDSSTNRLSKWENIQKRVQGFWKIWSKDYLHTLQQRYKWKHKEDNIKLGDIVLLKEDNLPPTKLALARVEIVHPGEDKLVRVVTIKTSSQKLLKRPITKLIKLPIE